MFCKKCGAEVSEEDKFCNKCGAPTGELRQISVNNVSLKISRLFISKAIAIGIIPLEIIIRLLVQKEEKRYIYNDGFVSVVPSAGKGLMIMLAIILAAIAITIARGEKDEPAEKRRMPIILSVIDILISVFITMAE